MSKRIEARMPNSSIVLSLREQINATLSDLAPTDSKFALLDYPNHGNLGDSAIYVGEIEYLNRQALQPTYVSCHDNCAWDQMNSRIGDGPIFIHGGGNFGDLWPWFQEFREEVLSRHPGRPIIQFPQTIYYSSQESIDRTARVIEKHQAFTLLVRDQRSLGLARKSFQCDVRLCPDMAFQIDCQRSGRPKHKLMLHLRDDQEAATHYDTQSMTAKAGVFRCDWPQEKRSFVIGTNINSLPSLAKTLLTEGPSAIRSVKWAERANARFLRAVNLLETSEFVITDRLHGHILCTLLDIPHCVLDNNYGKTSGFMKTWGTDKGCARLATNIPDAISILKRDFGMELD